MTSPAVNRTATSLMRRLAVTFLFAGLLGTSGAQAADPPLVVAHNMVNAWNRLDARAIADLFAKEGRFQNMMMDKELQGREALFKHFAALLEDASHLELKLRNIVAQGDTVFVERVDEFTYRGKDGSVPVVAVLQIENGLVSSWREYYDRAMLLDEMGINEAQH